jgi:hypothetical protein
VPPQVAVPTLSMGSHTVVVEWEAPSGNPAPCVCSYYLHLETPTNMTTYNYFSRDGARAVVKGFQRPGEEVTVTLRARNLAGMSTARVATARLSMTHNSVDDESCGSLCDGTSSSSGIGNGISDDDELEKAEFPIWPVMMIMIVAASFLVVAYLMKKRTGPNSFVRKVFSHGGIGPYIYAGLTAIALIVYIVAHTKAIMDTTDPSGVQMTWARLLGRLIVVFFLFILFPVAKPMAWMFGWALERANAVHRCVSSCCVCVCATTLISIYTMLS